MIAACGCGGASSCSRAVNSDSATSASEVRFAEPTKAWEWFFLIAMTACLLISTVWQTRKEFLGHDELFTSILASNPNYGEMFQAVRRGGELNPPLYFTLEWLIARVAGNGDLAMRALSGFSVTAAAWVLFFALRPLAGRRLAALGVMLIIGLGRDVFMFMNTARYYGWLFLLVALGVAVVLRLSAGGPVRGRGLLAVFLVNCALVYTHLYGCFYSGMLFVALFASDWLRREIRWKVFGTWLAAWATFLAWIPTTLQQIRSVTVGVWTPPGYYTLGFFINELGLDAPVALIVMLIILLGALVLVCNSRCAAGSELDRIHAPLGWTALALVALALMSVPVGTWCISMVRQPPLYMRRYIFPCTAAWVLMTTLLLITVYRLRDAKPIFQRRVSPFVANAAWCLVLLFCLIFQPMRAKKNPPRPASAYTDVDYGFKNLPMVFEGSWGFVHRVVYGEGRRYLLLIDRDAADASTGWYTKCMERFFQAWYPKYQKAEVARCKDLPDEFLAVDDDTGQTFEWVLPHHAEFQAKLLGTTNAEPAILGQQRTWLVKRVAPTESK